MATIKEVQLMDGENEVTPVVLADSIYNLGGDKYMTHTHDDRYYTESEINEKVNAINTALDGKLRIGKYVTEKLTITANTTKTLPAMEVGEVSVFSYHLTFDASSKVSYDTELPGTGKYFTLVTSPDAFGDGTNIDSQRIEVNMKPDWSGSPYTNRIHRTLSWNQWTTWIYILVIRFG